MTSFFHSYDLRGKYPTEISEKEAEKVGKAYGTFVKEKGTEEVLVGRDGRKHGKKITESFIKGINSTGVDVAYAGVAPSPVIYFTQVEQNYGSAAVVTASHNPSEYTGFKFNLENALAMSRSGGMEKIEQIYSEEEFQKGEGTKKPKNIIQDYISEVKNKIGSLDQEVLINCGNGVTGVMARELFEELGCKVTVVNEEVNGEFPNHLPDPGSQKAQETVKQKIKDEDVGIIFDGDGDRAGFILSGHGKISEDEILAIYSKEALERKKGKVLYDLRASKLVPEQIKKNGGEPIESRVGHTFISEQIHRDSEIVFAGELSGHFYFPIHEFPWDDGLFAAVLMTKILEEKGLRNQLESFKEYPVSPELRIDCPHKAKEPVIDRIKQEFKDHDLTTKDGVKIGFDTGWALIRPSNTEEKMSVRCEADTEESLEKILEIVEEKVRGAIKEQK